MLCARPESKWYFFRAVLDDGRTVICKGSMNWEPRVMETLSLIGEWVVYKGERQFQFQKAKLTLPVEERDQLHYVCERTNGIGKSIEEAIWNARGKDWRNLEFGEIKKLSRLAYENFLEQISLFASDSEKAETLAWLENIGCTPAMAGAAFEKWGSDTTGIVNENCYRLAELPGFSFKQVDEKIRGFFDIKDDDPRRIESAILYIYDMECADGSTVADAWKHLERVKELLQNIGEKEICSAAAQMKKKGRIFVFCDTALISSANHYGKERIIWNYLVSAASVKADDKILPPAEVLAEGEKFTPDESQISAVEFAVKRKISVINGGAGVGKTTVIKMIYRGIKALYPELDIRLCAPTGKAAARLKEASQIPATTIHVMLGAMGNDIFSAGLLEKTAVIIDESSMVDSALMAEILSRKPEKVILVGDQAQLTPVGNGQPFHDIIEMFPDIVRTLTKCYRNTEAVFQAASKIREGNLPARSIESENEKWTVVGISSPDEIERVVCAWAKQDEIDFEKDIVLCPKNGTKTEDGFQAATVNGFNAELLKIDREKRGKNPAEKYLPGDRVINTVNNPEKHVWNGSTGTVHAVDHDGMFVELDVPYKDEAGKDVYMVRFSRDMIKELRYAYALTIHKSQGSQYRKVFVVSPARDKFQLDRSLIYTGVTRAKNECIVVGDYNAFSEAINFTRHKKTALQAFALAPPE